MKCLLCREGELSLLLDLGQQPLANKYPKKEDFSKEEFYPMKVYFCPRCKNVQLGTIVSREKMFEDYYYLSSVNPGLVRHFETMAKRLANAKFVVDIGSNDGILLKPLKELGVRMLGIEPSINVSKIANDAGLETFTAFFDDKTANEVAQKYGKADAIVCSSVFTHVEDPNTFIEDVKKLMTDDGAFIVEVENIGHILKTIQFERFYLDRIYYYSLTSLKHFFEAHGMYIADVELVEIHGTSLRVVARKAGVGTPTEAVGKILAEESEILSSRALEAFRKSVDEQLTAFKKKLEEYKKDGLKVAGYGAPARVTTICNYGKIGPELVEFTVDDSPLKQNKFTPGTHIPIVPNNYLSGHKPDVLVVFAYEYFEDIKKKVPDGLRFLLPIPPKEVS